MEFREPAAPGANLRGLGRVAFDNVDEPAVFVWLEVDSFLRHRFRVIVVPGLLEDLLCERDASAGDQLVPDPEFEEPDYDVGVKQR